LEDRPTLLTSPLSQADFVSRVAYFALAPYGIVFCAALFPVAGALISVAVALGVFVAGETVRRWADASWLVRQALGRELSFEAFYRARPPRTFAYYVFYPLLFPYWLINRDARREFWLFKGYTAFSAVILLATVAYQYFAYWQPGLTALDYLPIVGLTLGIETLLVLAFLMPLATTVVHFHQSGRRRRLLALLLIGLASSGAALYRIGHRRDPFVSYATRTRVRLRTQRAPKAAHDAQLTAARAAMAALAAQPRAVEGDGKVEGAPLEKARQSLQRFYKPDEAYAFDLWASPRKDPKLMVLYFEARSGHAALWVAVRRQGAELTDPKQLPTGAFAAMRRAAKQ
jgi:hypothetical protein